MRIIIVSRSLHNIVQLKMRLGKYVIDILYIDCLSIVMSPAGECTEDSWLF